MDRARRAHHRHGCPARNVVVQRTAASGGLLPSSRHAHTAAAVRERQATPAHGSDHGHAVVGSAVDPNEVDLADANTLYRPHRHAFDRLRLSTSKGSIPARSTSSRSLDPVIAALMGGETFGLLEPIKRIEGERAGLWPQCRRRDDEVAGRRDDRAADSHGARAAPRRARRPRPLLRHHCRRWSRRGRRGRLSRRGHDRGRDRR